MRLFARLDPAVVAEVANTDTESAEPRSEALTKSRDAVGWGRMRGPGARRTRVLGPHHNKLSPSRSCVDLGQSHFEIERAATRLRA